MERAYWIGRKRASLAMARRATTSESRLIHYELAGRYSVKAALCLPFLLVKKAPAAGRYANPSDALAQAARGARGRQG